MYLEILKERVAVRRIRAREEVETGIVFHEENDPATSQGRLSKRCDIRETRISAQGAASCQFVRRAVASFARKAVRVLWFADRREAIMAAIRLRRKFVSLLLLLTLLSWAQTLKGGPTAAFKLVIDYSDGVQKQFVLTWKQDMTVLDGMNLAKEHPHGIKFVYDGATPDRYLLTQIDDVKNEGSGSGKRNWLYWVNSIPADKSFGVYKLKAGDKVVWKYAAPPHAKSQGQRKE
jgi:Domain of unknown function (DUF4430)